MWGGELKKSILKNILFSGLLIEDNNHLKFIHSTFMEYLAQLESSKEYNFVPKEMMDQYFLKDKSIIDKIVSIVNPNDNDIIIEVGAGIGSVSSCLPKIKKLLLVDLDKNLCKILRYNFRKNINAEVLELDAIKALSKLKFNKIIIP